MDHDELTLLNTWLSSMEFELETELPAELPEDFPYYFDRESLAALEQIVLSEFPAEDDLCATDTTEFVDRLVRFIGETLVRSFPGSQWVSGGEAFDGLPAVLVPDGSDVAECPLYLLTRLVFRRTGEELSRVFDGLTENIVELKA